MKPSISTPRTILYAAAADVVLVALFALSGRREHHEALSAAGVWLTAWPFLAALGLGWLVCRVWRAPLRIWPWGVCLWLVTVAGGITVRIASGRTAELPFVVVATLVLGACLLGHRFIAGLVVRRTARA